MNLNQCRFCEASLELSFADLGMSPPSNSYLKAEDLNRMEAFYPLHAFVCKGCWLVQLPQFHTPESIFAEYAYFSSYSESWLAHAKQYVDKMISRFRFTSASQVIELGSNDGYLLRYFKERGVPVLGVEPARNVAEVARKAGIPTTNKFFGSATAEELVAEGNQADLLLMNNVLAQVPNLRDFIKAMKRVLKPRGIFTIEFPHLLRLMEENQFDTIYHEHFWYFSFVGAMRLFGELGLTLFDVEELPTHGGSLRIFGRHSENETLSQEPRVNAMIEKETRAGLLDAAAYTRFDEKVKATKRELLQCLIGLKKEGKHIVGYGAPAKGNTLLNYCGIREDFLDYTVDLSPHKQGLYLPGTRIPIHSPNKIRDTKPSHVLILPWNLQEEIMGQISFIRDWGGKFIVPIPRAEIL